MIKYFTLLLLFCLSSFAKTDTATKESIAIEKATILICKERYFKKAAAKRLKILLKKYKKFEAKDTLTKKAQAQMGLIRKEIITLGLWKKYLETTQKIHSVLKEFGYQPELEELYNKRREIEQNFTKKTDSKFPRLFHIQVFRKSQTLK